MNSIETSDGTTLTMKIKMVTPQVAKQMLSNCVKNRRPSNNRIRRYSKGMELGEWVVAQPILFDDEGGLLDGQHRLHAVIDSKHPVEFLVVAGFRRENTFAKLDDVGKRTLKDWFHMQGVNNPLATAGVVHMAARHMAGLVPTSTGGAFNLTPTEGIEFFEHNPEIIAAVVAPGTNNLMLSKPVCSFCWWLFSKKDMALANTFFVDLTVGSDEGDTDPIYLLRERLKSDKRSKLKLPKTEKLALVIIAWNAVRKNETLFNLRWRSTGPTAQNFPEVM